MKPSTPILSILTYELTAVEMSSKGVLVTYASSREFLGTDHWKQVWAALLCQFPLRTLVWRSASRQGSQNSQTVQDLNVRLAPLESVKQEHTSQIPQTLLEKPLLNLYFVVCEVCYPQTYVLAYIHS